MRAQVEPGRAMGFEHILKGVGRYYTQRLVEHGPIARGADWSSEASQRLRFEQLLKVCGSPVGEVSLLDFGCGYGALADELLAEGWSFRYQGYDISAAMIEAGRVRHFGDARVRFVDDLAALARADYVVASGIFNVRLDTPDEAWEAYMVDMLDRMAALASRGFSFNVLTAYSDPERRRADLYYADPLRWFQHCRTRFSRHVALLHNYALYEFTILVNLVPLGGSWRSS